VAEFQAMVARLNAIFDEKAALLASLGQPHDASPANLVGLTQFITLINPTLP